MNKTKIEWVRNPDGTQGYTWNPITGCLNHVNGLCKGGGFPCYAYKLAHGRLRQRYLANANLFLLNDPFYPRFWPERLNEPYTLRKPSGIFPCDMSDLFGIGIPEAWTEEIMAVIKTAREHRFYLLTKQPQNLIKYSPFPPNCRVGVTATGYEAFNEALDHLKTIEAQAKYISIEPLLEGIKFYPGRLPYCGVSQLIIGAQTKPYKPPKIEWVQEIVEAADKAGVKVFLKDNILELVNYKSPETAFAFNKDGYYRQEFPKLKLKTEED